MKNQNQNLRVENKNNNGRMIILKKDIQRQKGLMLTDDWKKVKKYASDYVVAQELIPDTYLYKGYRVSLRYYLLVISHGQSKSFWIHPRGIVTYAKSRSNLGQGLEQFENMVASFYCSQNKYALGFPITLEDFYQEIGMEQGMEIWAGVRGIARMTALAVMDKIGWYQFKLENLSFELFGMDFLIDKDLKPKLIEVNVGPGMIPFGTQDAELRKKVYLDMFDKVGIQFSTMAGKGENEFRLLAFSEKK
jgi:hypothetical protein